MINNRKSKRHSRRHLIRFYRPVQTINLKRWPLRRLRVLYNNINNITIAIGGTNARRKTSASSARAGLWNFFLSQTRVGFYSTKRLSLFCSLGFGLTLIVFICMIVQRSNISSTNFNKLCFGIIDELLCNGIFFDNIIRECSRLPVLFSSITANVCVYLNTNKN